MGGYSTDYCAQTSSIKVFYPDKVYQNMAWSAEERNENIAMRHLYRDKYVSTHLIRLKEKEVPHYYVHHDLTVTAISGRHTLHFSDHNVSLKPGDVAFIPKGTLHWAENDDQIASTVFILFAPAYTGNDKIIIKEPS